MYGIVRKGEGSGGVSRWVEECLTKPTSEASVCFGVSAQARVASRPVLRYSQSSHKHDAALGRRHSPDVGCRSLPTWPSPCTGERGNGVCRSRPSTQLGRWRAGRCCRTHDRSCGPLAGFWLDEARSSLHLDTTESDESSTTIRIERYPVIWLPLEIVPSGNSVDSCNRAGRVTRGGTTGE